MKKIDLALAAGIVISIFLMSFAGFARDCGDVRQSVLRLHIIANSDSAEDQRLKLEVRDAILAGTSDLFESARSKEQAEEDVSKRLGEIELIAKNVITTHGYGYDAKAELINMFFETCQYGEITMPVGRYDAVRVKIGSAKGKNWWCVMFPPLCVPAAAEKTGVELQLLNSGRQPRYIPKLAVLELAEKIARISEDADLEGAE